jgi:hypothetical protein
LSICPPPRAADNTLEGGPSRPSGGSDNILRERPSFRVVDHTHRVFGAIYGQVRERVVRDAIKLMYRDGRTASDGKGPRIRNLVVVRPQAEIARRSGISS